MTGGQRDRNEEAERAVLSILLSGGDVDEALRRLSVEDFTVPAHQHIYTTVLRLHSDHVPVEFATVLSTMRKDDTLKFLPDQGVYLSDLTSVALSPTALTYYVKLVNEASTMRSIGQLGELAQHLSSRPESGDAAEILADLGQRINVLAEDGATNEVSPITEVLTDTLNEITALQKGEGVSGLPTGFTDLDDQLNGLHGGQMVVIAARPGVGKALAVDTPIFYKKTHTASRDGGRDTETVVDAAGVVVSTTSGGSVVGQWGCVGDVEVGDWLTTLDGSWTQVVGVSDTFHDRVCYEITFVPVWMWDKGKFPSSNILQTSVAEKVVADASHMWQVSTYTPEGEGRWGEPQLCTTAELASRVGTQAYITPYSSYSGMRFLVAQVHEVPPVTTRCFQVDHPTGMFTVGKSFIPTHNSSLALDIARNTAVRQDKSVLLFSLEMSTAELGMRALAAEAYVDLRMMRQPGSIDDHRWMQIRAAAERLHGKRLAFDDDPSNTLESIRAKSRLWRNQHGLDLIIIDYLQLMNTAHRADSRQQEVSEMSRNSKLLAKELRIPVIILSQLNRGPEQRTDKRPVISDLRESGCLPPDTIIHRADTGMPTTLGTLHTHGWVTDDGTESIPTAGVTANGELVTRGITNVFPTGTAPVWTITTQTGKKIVATDTHPFLTPPHTWTALKKLRTGDRIATPHFIAPPHHPDTSWDSTTRLQLHTFLTSTPLATFPESLYRAPDDLLARLMKQLVHHHLPCRTTLHRHLNNECTCDTTHISVPTTNPIIAEQLSHLLLRFGIIATRTHPTTTHPLPSVTFHLSPHHATLFHTTHNDTHPTPPHTPPLSHLVPPHTPHIYWDTITSIEPGPTIPVYDMTVDDIHNFIAHDIIVKNSIEQDADVVLLIHRDDIYDKETPRAGIADVMVAKNRSGPTGSVELSWLGKFSRFDNRTI